MEQKSSKKRWIWIGIGLFAVIVLCTFLSRSIHNALLPQVEAARPTTESITREITATGSVIYADEPEGFFLPMEVRVVEILIKKGDMVTEDSELLRIDLADYELACMEFDSQVMQLEHTLSGRLQANMRKELEAQLAIVQRRYEGFQALYPEDGIIRASQEGRIEAVEAEVNKTYPAQATLFEIRPGDARLVLEFPLSMEEAQQFSQRGEVSFQYRANGTLGSEMSRVNTSVTTMEFSVAQQRYLCRAGLKDAPLEAGQQVRVTLKRSSAVYDMVVPASAVVKDSRGMPAVFILETRAGLFGDERYVRQISVTVNDENGLLCAISANDISGGYEIVNATTAPLANGTTVAVKP